MSWACWILSRGLFMVCLFSTLLFVIQNFLFVFILLNVKQLKCNAMDEKNSKQRKEEKLPDWLQPQDGIKPGIDISEEEAEEVTRFLKEELGVDPTL